MNKLIILLSATMTFFSSGLAVAANQSEPLNLDELTAAFGWDMDRTAITTEKVTDNLYVMFGVGGNIGVSIGSDGVLIVDNQFPNMMSKIDAAVKKLGADNIDLAVNTHWHLTTRKATSRWVLEEPSWWPIPMPEQTWRPAESLISCNLNTDNNPILKTRYRF